MTTYARRMPPAHAMRATVGSFQTNEAVREGEGPFGAESGCPASVYTLWRVMTPIVSTQLIRRHRVRAQHGEES